MRDSHFTKAKSLIQTTAANPTEILKKTNQTIGKSSKLRKIKTKKRTAPHIVQQT
jgi:hypothetical protein